MNLGVLAHVDAGKTSLTERLLFAAGVIDEVGSVDDGNTQTDSMALERQRGITIKSAVVSFDVGGRTVNLIDTPGHPDFIAEVERVLGVLDGTVLVISAVEGVQAQTRVLFRALRRLGIPTLIFVNKIDRRGARPDGVLAEIADRLTGAAVAMGTVTAPGTREADFRPHGAEFDARHLELLAEHDDALLAAYVADTPVPHRRLRTALAEASRRGLVHPVFFGSASTGAGVDALLAGVTELLPAAGGDAAGPVSGTVFKVDRGPAGEKIAYVRMFSGTVHTRDRLPAGKVTAISVFGAGAAGRADSVTAGQIGMLWGLTASRIGTEIGTAIGTGINTVSPRPDGHRFAPPTLETVVLPRRAADRGPLHQALTRLAEQDPLINLRQDELRQELSVSLYGEVQKEVIEATLATEFGLAVSFRESTTICIERPAGSGAAVELIDKAPNPFLATVGLRVDPAPEDSGVAFRLGVELGSMPYAFFTAVEETVRETLHQGLRGWRVTDCTVTMTHSGYWPKQSHAHAVFDKSMSSTARDFRQLTPLVLMTALRRAGTRVYEPMHRFRLEIPTEQLGVLQPTLVRLRAVPRTSRSHGPTTVLEGEIPAGKVHELQRRLPGLTRGEGSMETGFAHYQRITATPPSRPRTDHNPLDRKEYLLRVQRRV
ncbi:MAG TPA: translation factor GTPase family protein [Actinophytocola sp.]|nr:translation factor GTPase family protein [Actinophytocola sp.]